MALATDIFAVITENLTDVGLDEKAVAKCIEMFNKKEISALQEMLSEYRVQLLNNVHKYSKQIDCLDYFTYTLNKSLEEK